MLPDGKICVIRWRFLDETDDYVHLLDGVSYICDGLLAFIRAHQILIYLITCCIHSTIAGHVCGRPAYGVPCVHFRRCASGAVGYTAVLFGLRETLVL